MPLGSPPETELFLDFRGMLCPMPALLARKRLKGFSGKTVLIWATDPMAEVDIGVLAKDLGYTCVAEHLPEGVIALTLVANKSISGE